MRPTPCLVLPLLLPVLACGGGGTNAAAVSQATPASQDFTLAVTPPAAGLPSGGTASAAATVTRTGGHSGAVALGLAANAQGFTGAGSIAAGAATGSLPITAPSGLAAGSYNLTVTATDGTLSRTAACAVQVVSTTAADYVLTISPPASVAAGTSSSATATVVRSGGHGAALVLALASNAQGITGSGTVAAGASSGILNLAVPATTAAGSHTLSATATDGSLARTAAFTLPVTAAVLGSSHNPGRDCLGCHSGAFKVAGTVYTSSGAVYPGATIRLTTAATGGGTVVLSLTADASGNFRSGSAVSFGSGLYADAAGAAGTRRHMSAPVLSGACNGCHGSSNRIIAD